MRGASMFVAAWCVAALLQGCGTQLSAADRTTGGATRAVDECVAAWNGAGDEVKRSLAFIDQQVGHTGRVLVASYQGPEQQVDRVGGGPAILVQGAACVVVSDAGLVYVHEQDGGWGRTGAAFTEQFSRFAVPGAVEEDSNASTAAEGRIELDPAAPDTTLTAEDVNGDPPGSPTSGEELKERYCEQHPDDESCATETDAATKTEARTLMCESDPSLDECAADPVPGAADADAQALRQVCGKLNSDGTEIEVRIYGGVESCVRAQGIVQDVLRHVEVRDGWRCAPEPQIKCSRRAVTVLGAVK